LRRILIVLCALLPASVWLSCGGYSSPSSSQSSGLTYRAFLSNTVSSGTLSAGVYVIDASKDVNPGRPPISAGNSPNMMVLTPNHALTLVFSGDGTQFADNLLTVISNSAESAAAHVNLPGHTDSFVVSPDSSTAYVAVPTAPVVGQPPGIVEAISLSTGVSGQAEVPGVHYLAIDNLGGRLLGFSDNSDQVAVITPSQIGIGPAVTYVGGFDRPVAAFFSSDNTTAYVLNCGAECGGTQASVQQFDLTTNALGLKVPACSPGPNSQCAGSEALVNGSTMYVAGTPPKLNGVPSQPCTGETTASTSCGLLNVIDLNSMSVTNTAPIIITDGYHNRMALGANGQLFIGARTCTEIVPTVPPPTGAETRGCLSIYNTQTGAVVIPPKNGDVTGIQPLSKRPVVYVVQNGSLGIYDTTTDALQTTIQIVNLVGQFFDVKTPDF
jgi:hypothetical protein